MAGRAANRTVRLFQGAKNTPWKGGSATRSASYFSRPTGDQLHGLRHNGNRRTLPTDVTNVKETASQRSFGRREVRARVARGEPRSRFN